MKWGKPRAQIPSRFLMEMRGETERARKAAEASVLMFRTAEKTAESAPTKPVKKSAQRRGAPDARKPTRR